ncbi:MAG: hypothetical protein KGZ40_02380 [Clostridiales bacterium]|nr:hypothetical protein [Clostridiales bacterium]
MGRHEVGAELRAELQGRGCALSAREARALSILLIDLIADGLLAPGTEGLESPAAYNMGDSVYRPEDEKT